MVFGFFFKIKGVEIELGGYWTREARLCLGPYKPTIVDIIIIIVLEARTTLYKYLIKSF